MSEALNTARPHAPLTTQPTDSGPSDGNSIPFPYVPSNAVPTEVPSFLTKTDLLERGWTEAAIKRFAFEPDQLKRNPYYRSGSPMKFYLLDRIEAIEKTPEFIEWQQKSEKRKGFARRAVETKTVTLLAEVKQVTISVQRLPRKKLCDEACWHYNMRQLDRGQIGEASRLSNREFLERIQVNYIRHQLSEYDGELKKLFRRVGKTEAYDILRRKVFDAIIDAYSYLRDECERQYERDGE